MWHLILIDQMIKNLLNLFFPQVCFACHSLLSDGESDICTECRHAIPVTNYHYNDDDTVEKVFHGRVKIECGTALFQFHKKGIVQQLIHNLKYRGYEQIGKTLGQWLGYELNDSKKFNSIDYVIPVPLHKKKLRKRGFNQVAKFGQEIAKAINAEYLDDVLLKSSSTQTKVFRARWARWSADKSVFVIKNGERLKGKHLLLVDDIITTGATIEDCCNVLQEQSNVKISVATMAITN